MVSEAGGPQEAPEVSQPSPLKKAEAEAPPSPEGVVDAVAEENGKAENGHAAHKEGPESSAASAAATEEGSGEPAEEELWRRRLWFVRIPKPPELGAVKALEQELETYRAQYKLLTESFTVKKVERDAARDNTRSARDAFKACREAYEAKRAVVQPMRDAAQGTSAEAKKLREQFSELEVRSEAELDERLEQLHYRIEHESIPLNEEKRILQQIKKLESQRAKVREYESLVGTLAESRTEVKRLEGELSEHKAELAALQAEKNTQWSILEKFREQEQALDREVEEILAERKRVKELLDEAYSRVSELKSMQKAKNDEFYGNRRFSRSIREVLAAGKLEEAREMCAQQMEEAHAKLSSDADYRAEYFTLWEQQRKVPVSAAVEDGEEDLPAPRGGRGGRGGERRAPAEPAVEPAKKAEAVIAAVLEEARDEILRVKAAAASAAAAAAPMPAVAEAAGSLAEAEPEAAAKPAAKPHKPRKEAPRHVVEVPVIPQEEFELPEAIKAKKAPSAEELKALEREHQRQVQADAERRKLRKQQEAEKKRQRALREQAARQAAKLAASSGAASPNVESDAAPEASGDESGQEGAAGSGSEGPAAAPAAAAAAASAQPTAAGKAAAAKPSKVAAINKPKSTAKRPAHTKKPLDKQLREVWKKHKDIVVVVGVLLLLAALFGLSQLFSR